jgi:hypothetical protein
MAAPTNKQIEFVLSLRDNLTAQWKSTVSSIKAGGSSLVSTFKANWLAISASALAAFAMIQKGMEFSEGYANFAQSMAAFKSMAASVGMDATAEFQKLREASRGLIDDKSLVESANRAMSLGIPLEKLAGFIQVASAKARDMGTDTTAAFNDLVVALGRGSAPILDNLGIIVKTEAANKAYADSLGKTVDQLTDAEKKQAFMNAALEAGQKALERQNLEVLSYNEQIQKIKASIANAELFLGQIVTRITVYLMGVANGVKMYLSGLATAFLSTLAFAEKGLNKLGITQSTMFQDMRDTTSRWASEGKDALQGYWQTAFLDMDKFQEAVGGGTKAVGKLGKVIGTAGGDAAGFAKGSLGQIKEKIAELTKSLQTMIIGSKEYKATLAEIKRLEALISPEKIAKKGSARLAELLKKYGGPLRKFKEQVRTTNAYSAGELAEVNVGSVPGLDAALKRYEEQRNQLGVEWDAMIAGMDAGVMSLSDSITQAMGDAWEGAFGEANSVFEKFLQSVYMGMVDMLGKWAAKQAMGGLLSLIPGGGVLSGLLGGSGRMSSGDVSGGVVPTASASSALAQKIDSLSGSLSSRPVVVNLRGTLAGQQFLQEEMPGYNDYVSLKTV